MSDSPAPLLRPPIPGARSQSRGRIPLGLAIPPSPNHRPVTQPPQHVPSVEEIPQLGQPLGLHTPPPLRLSTPLGSNLTPQEGRQSGLRGRLPPLQLPQLTTAASSDTSAHTRSGSSGDLPPTNNVTTVDGFRHIIRHSNSNDPLSASSSLYSAGGHEMKRENSMGISINPADQFLQQFSQLSLSLGHAPDVQDLDDDGWLAASESGQIVELGSLGEGAGGAVTKCKIRGGNTVFALKIITTDPNPDVKKQIVRELAFNKNSVSDHICAYYGAFISPTSGTISIAMEYCEGGSLDSVYREVKRLGGRTGEKVLGKVAEGVLRGLTYLHEKRIIHRDIKPSNILLTRDGRPKLCDFGVSGESGTGGMAATFIGTSYYMAPERITGQSYTITADVWSLGVTLLEVAQHRFPFPADEEGRRAVGANGEDESHPRLGPLDLVTYIVKSPTPKLRDEPKHVPPVKWSEDFKYFIEVWYVLILQLLVVQRSADTAIVSSRTANSGLRHGGCSNTHGCSR